MRFLFLIIIVFALVFESSLAQTITTGNITKTIYCSGEDMSVPYTKTGTFNAGNVFTAYLSDVNGDFGNSTSIGTLASTSDGTISCIIPKNTLTGSSYYVRVISSNPNVDGTTNATNLTISTTPTPSLKGDTIVCAESKLSYDGKPGNDIVNKWRVTGGTINGADDGDAVDIEWKYPGTGSVTLLQTNTVSGCKDSVVKTITINPLPPTYFIQKSFPVCEKSRYTYIGNTIIGINNRWIITGGTIIGASNGGSVDILWGSAGTGEVIFEHTDAITGCKDTISLPMDITPMPKPEITLGADSVCSNRQYEYTGTVVPGVSNKWTVKGGSIFSADDGEILDVNWGNVGKGSVTLTQTDLTLGCKDSIVKIITINPIPKPFISVFPNPVCSKNHYIYTGNSEAGVNNQWIVEGGSINGGNVGESVDVTWGPAGSGKITLKQNNIAAGCTDSAFKMITINPLPEPKITVAPDPVCTNLQYTYVGSVSSGSSNKWVVNGGKIIGADDGAKVDILWGPPGQANIKLVQKNPTTGCSDSISIFVSILDNPKAVINPLDSACANKESRYAGLPYSYFAHKWNVTNGTIIGSDTNSTIVVKWGQPGNGKIFYIAYNKILSIQDTISKVFIIYPLPRPGIYFDKDTTFVGNMLKFWAKDHGYLSYKWTATKGTIIGKNTNDTVFVKWNTEGSGKVVLYETDDISGCMDSIVKIIYIRSNSSLILNGPYEICQNDTANYSTLDIAGAENFWTVENGDILQSTNSTLVIVWRIPGNGKIKLIQNNSIKGTKDSIEREVVIHPLPLVTLDKFPDLCFKDTIYQLIGGNPDGGKYYINNVEKTQFNPIDFGSGIFYVRYEYTDTYGCSNKNENTITVHPEPAIPTITEDGDSLTASPGVTYQWYHDGKEISGATGKVLHPDTVGTFAVIAFDSLGCQSGLSEPHYYFNGIDGAIIEGDQEKNFGTLICNYFKDDTLKVQNPGTQTLTISSAEISGADKDDFAFTPAFQQSDILSKAKTNFAITFRPRTVGTKEALVTFKSNAVNKPEFGVILKAKKDSIGFVLSDSIIKFDNVESNKQFLDNTLKITNTGTVPITWPNTISISSNFDIISIVPNPTPINNGESIVTARFNGGPEGFKTLEEYLFTEDYCKRQLKLELEASVGTKPIESYVVIKIDSSIGLYKPGDLVEIPILLFDQKNLDKSKITGFSADLKFNSTMLVPTIDSEQGTITGNVRTIQLNLSLTPINSNILKTLYFTATLGNDTTTILRFENLRTLGDSIEIKSIGSRFTIAGICTKGGARLINSSNQVALNIIKPNPSESEVEIDFSTVEESRTQIIIYSMLGDIVINAFDGIPLQGNHLIKVNISDLSTGSYFVVMHTPTENRTAKIYIIK